MIKSNIIENPVFSEEIKKLQTTDKAHADIFNELFQTLMSNDLFLKKLANEMIHQSNIIHSTEITDPEKIPGADVTGELQSQITKQAADIEGLQYNVEAEFKEDCNDMLGVPSTMRLYRNSWGHNMPLEGNRAFLVEVYAGVENIVQIATCVNDLVTEGSQIGKKFKRVSLDSGATWSAWESLDLDKLYANKASGFHIEAPLSSAGYYRVAKISTGRDDLSNFSSGSSCLLNLNTNYWNNSNMSVTLLCNLAYKKYAITKLGGAISDKPITKVRVAKDSEFNVYLDVYYVSDKINTVNIDVLNTFGSYSRLLTPAKLEAVTDTNLTTLVEYTIV